ncbi:hypothetical protein Tco_0441130 [Tanacetum coccineum]
MDCKFFSRLIKDHLSLEPQGIALGTTLERGVLLGPKGSTYYDLSDTNKKTIRSNVRATNIVLQGLPKDIYKLINHNIEAKAIGTYDQEASGCSELTKEIRISVCTDELRDLALNEDNIFQADECDAFDSDVDDEPTAQSIFMANLSSVGSTNPQAGPSNASILSEVHILENAIDHSVSNQDEHEIHNKVQPSNVIDSTSVHMGNSNVIPYEQYLSVNDISGVPSCASSALNSVCVSPVNDAFVPHDPIATELKIYKEQVAIYEQRAKFELTEREQRMDDQMRMLIQNRNKTEENLKKELHSFKLQLKSTMENNKIIEETVTTLKQEFKQKESKFLTDFSNLKHLNDKLENKLHSQDQSIQTVHMMLNPTQVYDQKTKTALGAQNPFYLKLAKRAQPALYDGDELLKPHHMPVIVSTSEEKLELTEATRNKLHVKMNDSVCVEKRVNITPPNYSKENFMATFTPQTQLTPEQVFWSLDLAKRKAEELKANATPLPVLPSATVYPPNTPAHLVPRTLPTTSQVNIGLYEKISRLTKKNSDTDPIFDLKALVSQNKDLTAKFNALHDLNECFRAENAKVKQHYKELYDSIKITRAKTTDHNNSLLYEIEHLKDQLRETSKCVTIPDCKPKVLALETLREIVEDAKIERPLDTSLASACRYTKHSQELLEYVIGASAASMSKPRSNTKTDRTLPAKSALKQVEAHARMNKSNEKHKNHVDSSISYKHTVVHIVLWYLDSGCSKHMTGDRSRLKNFVKRFIGTVRFGNNHFGAIMGYGDYVIGYSVISRVYYVEGLGHNLFLVGQFCDSDLEVAFKKYTCFVRDLDGVDLIKGSHGTNLYTISVEDMMRSSPICLLSKASKNKS